MILSILSSWGVASPVEVKVRLSKGIAPEEVLKAFQLKESDSRTRVSVLAETPTLDLNHQGVQVRFRADERKRQIESNVKIRGINFEAKDVKCEFNVTVSGEVSECSVKETFDFDADVQKEFFPFSWQTFDLLTVKFDQIAHLFLNQAQTQFLESQGHINWQRVLQEMTPRCYARYAVWDYSFSTWKSHLARWEYLDGEIVFELSWRGDSKSKLNALSSLKSHIEGLGLSVDLHPVPNGGCSLQR